MDLFGRQQDLETLVGLLRERRLVTVTGPGGVGKTALAEVAAATVAPDFAYGTRTVDLTRIDREVGVREAIAGQLGFADWQSLMDSPGDAPALIVLDNCEHVLDAAADAAIAVLEVCVMPTLLATSRSPLDTPGEAVLQLGPLPIPDPSFPDPDHPAIRLFLTRVREHGVELDRSDLAPVAEVCALVDGVPLAIELAAARLRYIGIDELRRELRERPHELGRSRFRGRASHRSVSDVVTWSIDHLTPEAREVFARLGVTAGPFGVAMAEAVAAHGDADVVAALEELVAASLLVADTTGPAVRYRMLHPIRAVAVEMLRADSRYAETQSRLVDHAVAVALDVVARAVTGWNPDVLGDLLRGYDNLLAALRWTLDHDEDPDRAFVIVAVLWGVVHQAHTAEIGEVARTVLDRWPAPDHDFWPHVIATAATCANQLGRPAEAVELARAALDHTPDSHLAQVTLHRVLALASLNLGRRDESLHHFEASATAARAVGALGFALESDVHRALVAFWGDRAAALEAIERSLAEAEEIGSVINVVRAHEARASLVARDDPAAALGLADRALELARAARYPAGVAQSLETIAGAALSVGDHGRAADAIVQLLDELLATGGLNDSRMALFHAAQLLDHRGDERWADLAMTAAALPVTTTGTPIRHEIYERAAATGRVLSLTQAYTLCRQVFAGSVVPGADAPHREPGPSNRRLVAEADVWRVDFGGRTVRVKASKGMSDLAVLLRQPGRELSCLELAGGALAAGDSRQEVIDEQARGYYEQRIRDLQDELEEARANHDQGRAERLEDELDALVEHLTDALGMSGRSRAMTDAAERARSAVTHRIRATIRHLAEVHPALGGHLERTVTTGRFCMYEADGTPWQVHTGAG